jgi:hypothetical protein
MDTELASHLTAMAAAEEQAVHAFFRVAMADDGFADELERRAGWRPGRDPVELWAAAEHAPDPVWLVDWPEPPEVVRHLVDTTASHLGELRAIVESRGWPGRSAVGEDGADAAWFLAMHADADPQLQWRCVDLLEPAVGSGEADPRHLAVLADRITSAAVGDQLYGSLAVLRDARPVFLVPVRDPDGLDRRRGAIGLPRVMDDLVEDAGRGQLPYRQHRQTPLYAWPPARQSGSGPGDAGAGSDRT